MGWHVPVDFQSIQQQVRQWGESAPLRAHEQSQRRGEARQRLADWSDRPEELRGLVERAANLSPGLRCACPAGEPAGKGRPLPVISGPYSVLAADGSQINPDRHGRVEYCVINVGAFSIYPDQPQPAREMKSSRLLNPDELYTVNGLVTEEFVALTRDLAERSFLAG
ncbi:MAG TPA: hypothetical protein VF813_03950, partial [Anaerolineaceae bacterium]